MANALELIAKEKIEKTGKLDLGNCGLTELPDELFELVWLEELIISNEYLDDEKEAWIASLNKGEGNKLTHLSPKIGQLEQLKKFYCAGNFKLRLEIMNISFLSDLNNLEFLDLRSNQITDYSFLSSLTKLQDLHLNNNQITDYTFLKGLTQLQSLYLMNNQITDISFLSDFTNLQVLVLSYNQITDISFLSGLFNLQSLYLSSNQIVDISFLSSLINLQSLELESNQITNISFLSDLSNLEYLNLISNQITNISFLSGLTNLQSLYLMNNQITNISFLLPLIELGKMPLSLEPWAWGKINLHNNPIQKPPIEIIKQGNQAVIDWFEASKKVLEEIKIVLVGEPKAGKTSILRRLKDNVYVEGEKQTDGINIESIAFEENEHFEAQQHLHTLTGHFWDFGGQEIMSATHQFFLTNRSVYVLVLEARKDTQITTQVRKWLQQIQANGGNSPIIVVANQIDVNKGFGFENEVELQQEFPQIKAFIKTSCKTGENLDELRDLLEQFIPEAELFHTEIDERWIDIKDELQAETNENCFLNETKFIEICEKHNLHNNRQQQDAILFLHDLGLVLHFDDIDTSEYFVLNPYWITYGVYQVLTSTFAGNAKGDIPMTELKYIINKEADKSKTYETQNFKKIRYSSGERKFLVDVLHQFKLCFYVDNRKRFILPDLLDTKEPQAITKPIRQATEKIELVYEYSYLPKSFMPYFMVETHKIQMANWRTGCVICRGSCEALIATYDNQLKVIVVGEFKAKREFMSVIRFLVEHINQNLNQRPSMLIPLPNDSRYADYEELLEMEKDGERYYKVYRPKQKFEISELLDGFSMPTNERELHQVQQKLNQLLESNDYQTRLIKQQGKMLFREFAELNSTLEILDKKGDIYQHELVELLMMIEAKETIISDAFATDIITIIQKGMTDFEANVPQAKDIITAWQAAQNQLKLGADSKAKLKLTIPFLFLKLEKELTWNGKDWFKAIRADIERGRKGNWSEMFVYED